MASLLSKQKALLVRAALRVSASPAWPHANPAACSPSSTSLECRHPAQPRSLSAVRTFYVVLKNSASFRWLKRWNHCLWLIFIFYLSCPSPAPPLSDCVLITCSISRHKSELCFSYVYMTVQSPDRTSMCFSRWQRWDRSRVSGGKSCSQFPISLFLVQRKCRSTGLDVYLTPHALIQRGQEIGAWMLLLWQMGMCWIAHIVRQGALGLEVVLTSLSLSGFCLELQTQRAVQTVTLSCPSAQLAVLPQSPLCHCIRSRSQGSLQRKLLWAYYSSDISFPKEINCINSWERRLNLMGMCHLGCGKTQAPKESLGIYHHSSTQIGVHKDTNLLL